MQTEFAPMKSLGFPCHDFVCARSKRIREVLSEIRQTLRKETGFGLDLHPWEATQKSGRRQRGSNNSATGSNSNSCDAVHVPQGNNGGRLQYWNVPGLDACGQIVRDPECGVNHLPYLDLEINARASITWPPPVSEHLQDRLIDIHYEMFHYLPIMRKQDMKYQLQQCRLNMPTTHLSPFFFYALFASAALCSGEPSTIAEYFFHQALAFRETFAGYSSPSSVLALILMANYLEGTKQQRNAAHAWLLAGEASRMAQHMGLHRQGSGHIDPEERAFGIRTFWIAFINDRLMSLVYGKPFVFHEEDMHVSLPTCTPTERSSCVDIEQRMSYFNCMIDIAKVAGRIIKLNYAANASRMRDQLHQGVMLSTLDSWISSLVKASLTRSQGDSPQQLRFDRMRILVWHALMILLHIPYIDHDIANNSRRSPEFRPSLDICNYSAVIVTHLLYQMPPSELQELATRSYIVHAILTATRVHLMNASFPHDHESITFGEISFLVCMKILRSLPSAEHPDSWLARTINAFQNQFDTRSKKIISDYALTHLEHIILLFSNISDRNSGESTSRPWNTPEHDPSSPSSMTATSSNSSVNLSTAASTSNNDNDGASIRIIQFDYNPSSGTAVSRQSSNHRQNGRGPRRKPQQQQRQQRQQQQQQQAAPQNESPSASPAQTTSKNYNNNGNGNGIGLAGHFQIVASDNLTVSSDSSSSNAAIDYFGPTETAGAANSAFSEPYNQQATVNQNMFQDMFAQANQGGLVATNASYFPQGVNSTNVQQYTSTDNSNELLTFYFPIFSNTTSGQQQPIINDVMFGLPNTTASMPVANMQQFWYQNMS